MDISQSNNASRRGHAPSTYASPGNSQLHLNALPRFHPANYNSASSITTTAGSSDAYPSQPLSPRSSARYLDPDQRQLSYYHQHLVEQSTMGANAVNANGKKPSSPKLAPVPGSPGPVTPLELEGENYLSAGTSSTKSSPSVEAILHQDAKRRMDPTRRSNS
jgi:hypothetical protein